MRCIFLILILCSCTKKVITFTSDTTRIVSVTHKPIPPIQITQPEKGELTTVKILKQDSIIIKWKYVTIRDTIVAMVDSVDCPDCDSVAIFERINSLKTIVKEKTLFGQIWDHVRMWGWVVVLLLAVFLLWRFFK